MLAVRTVYRAILVLCTLGGACARNGVPHPAPTAPVHEGIVTPTVTAVAGAPDGWATYRLSAELNGNARSVYAIFGRSSGPMSLPPAYHEATPFGAHVGGVNPAFVAVNPSAAYDSWLTVSVIDGDNAGALTAVGIDFASWTATTGVTTDEGAVFFRNPDAAPDGSAVVGQITVQADATVTMGMQGRSASGRNDWSEDSVTFFVSGGGGGGAAQNVGPAH